MLDQLIESKDQIQEKKKLGSFMLTTSFFVITLLIGGLIYSLFSQTVVLGSDNLEISTLIAPVQMEIKPQPVDQPKPQKSEKPVANDSKMPTRKAIIQQMEETPVEIPKTISVTPSNQKARPNSPFLIGSKDTDPINDGAIEKGNNTGIIEKNPIGIKNNSTPIVAKEEKIEEPPPIVKKTPEKVPPIISGGVVNGKALNLVKPVYSAAAKNLGVKGEVRVQVTIDENGNVISANAVSGHQMLRNSAVNAARASRFTPTTLSQQKVKVTGYIIYNFS